MLSTAVLTPAGVDVYKHLVNYSMSRLQKHICRILLMVPIRAVHAGSARDSPGPLPALVRRA
jgi:hypothetical protein